MFEIPLTVTGLEEVRAATAAMGKLSQVSRASLEITKKNYAAQEAAGNALDSWQRALKKAIAENETFNKSIYQKIQALKSDDLAQRAAVDAYYKQVDALTRATAANKAFSESHARETQVQQNALKVKEALIQKQNAAIIVNREAIELTAKNAIAEKRLTDAKYAAQKVEEARLAGLAKLQVIRQQELNQLAVAKARLDALSDTQRKDLAIMKEKLRLQNAVAVAEAKTSGQLADLTTKLKALTAQQEKNVVATKKMSAAGLSLNTNLHITNQLAASMRAGMSGIGTSFGIYTSSTILLATAVYGLFRNIKTTISVGAAYQDLLARVGAVSTQARFGTDEYADALERLNAKALEVSATTRFTATQTLEAMKELAMAGLSVEEIMQATESVLQLASIGMISYGQAADIATNIMLGFGLEVSSLSHIVDVMAVAVTGSNQNIAQMGNALSYAAPVAKSLGISLEFVSAATMVLANSGIKASRAGTGLRRIFISLYAPSKKAAEAMERFGIAVEDAALSAEELESLESPIEGLFEAGANGTQKFIDKLKQFYLATDGARENIDLLREAVGVRALPAFIQLIRGLELGEKSLDRLTASLEQTTDAASDMFSKISASLQADWEVLLGAMETARNKVFLQVTDTLQEYLASFTFNVQAFSDSEEAIKALLDSLKTFGEVVLNVLKALAMLKLAMSAFALMKWAHGLVVGLGAELTKLRSVLLATSAAQASVAATSTLVSASGAAIASSAAGAAASVTLLGKAWEFAKLAGIAFVKSAFGLALTAAAAAVIYFVSKLVDLGAILRSVSGAFSTFTEARDAKINTILEETNRLLSGGLEELYRQRNELALQIEEYGKITNMTAEQQSQLAEVRERHKEVNDQIKAGNDLLNTRARDAARIRESEIESQIRAKQAEQEMAERQLKQLNDFKESGLRGKLLSTLEGTTAIEDKVQAITAEMGALAVKSAEVKGILAELAKTPAERMALLQEATKGVAEQLQKLNPIYDSLRAQMDEMLKAGKNSLNSEEFERIQRQWETTGDAIQALQERLTNFNEGMKRTSRDLSAFTVEDILKSLEVVVSKYEQESRRLQLSEEQLTAVMRAEAQKRVAVLEDQLRAYMKQIEGFKEAIRIMEERGLDSSDLKAELARVVSVVTGIIAQLGVSKKELKELMEQEQEAAAKAADALKKQKEALEALHGKYDPIAKQQYALAEAFAEIESLLNSGIPLAGGYEAALLQVAASILEVDSSTGRLTDSSRELVEETIAQTKASLAELEVHKSLLVAMHAEEVQRISAAIAIGKYTEATKEAIAAAATQVTLTATEGEIENLKGRLAGLNSVLNNVVKTTGRSSKATREHGGSTRDLAKSYKELEPTIENYNKMLKEMNELTEEGKAARDWVLKNQEALIKQGYELDVILPKNRVELQKIIDNYDKAGAAAREYEWQQKLLNALLKEGHISLEVYNQALNEQREAYISAQGPMAQYLEGLRKQVEITEATTVDFLDKFRTGLIDTLAEGKNGFEDFADYVKKRLIELAVNTIFIEIIGRVTTTGGSGTSINVGSSGGGSSLFGGGGFGGLFGNSIGSGLEGFGTDLFASSGAANWWAGTGGPNLIGTPNLAFIGGSLAGGLLGNALFGNKGFGGIGSSIGSAGGSAIGAAVLGNAVFPGFGAIIGGLLGGVGGGFLGSLFGDEEPVPRIKAGVKNGWLYSTGVEDMEPEQLEQAKQQAAAINQLIGGLRYAFGEKGQKAVEEYNEPVMGFGPEHLARAGNQVLQAVLDRAVASGDEMAKWISDQVNGKLGDTLEESAEAVIGLVTQLQMLPLAFEAFDKLGLSLGDSGESAAVFAMELAKLAGGMQNLLAAEEFYYANFYTEQERAQNVYDEAEKRVNAFNEELGLTGDSAIDTREELRAYIDSLDLTTEAGREAYIAALGVAGAIVDLEDAFKNIEEAVPDTNAALLDLAQTLRAVAMSVSNMIGSARETIEKFGLSNKELYERNVKKIHTMQEEMKYMTNPADIQSHAQKIIDLAMENWNLLDDTQKAQLQDGFLKWLDNFDLFTADQLERIANENGLEIDTGNLDDLASGLGDVIIELGGTIDSLTLAIQAQREAAGSTEESAGAMSAAAAALSKASAAMPRKVDVTVNLVRPAYELG